MFGIYMFGSALEQFFGTRFYVTLYFVSVVTAGLTQLAVNALLGSPYATVGASGGLFGLLLAFAMYFPQQRLMMILLPIPIPARVFVTLYAVIELVLGVTGTQQGVAHFAHLGGLLGAFLMIQWRRGKPPFFPRRRR
jgi:membrane associated rhomboid family serine protease